MALDCVHRQCLLSSASSLNIPVHSARWRIARFAGALLRAKKCDERARDLAEVSYAIFVGRTAMQLRGCCCAGTSARFERHCAELPLMMLRWNTRSIRAQLRAVTHRVRVAMLAQCVRRRGSQPMPRSARCASQFSLRIYITPSMPTRAARSAQA